MGRAATTRSCRTCAADHDRAGQQQGRGHRVTAIDWSPQMVQRTSARAEHAAVGDRVQALVVGAHELERIDGASAYDGAYSNLGPLNCVPELSDVSKQCARLLKKDGALVFTVIGRVCPWEILYYLRRLRLRRIGVRFAREAVPVTMNQHTIWTRYYRPREFYRCFSREFDLEHYRGLCVFAPPPYVTALPERHRRLYDLLWRMDRSAAGWPGLRGLGDHFLVVMRKR